MAFKVSHGLSPPKLAWLCLALPCPACPACPALPLPFLSFPFFIFFLFFSFPFPSPFSFHLFLVSPLVTLLQPHRLCAGPYPHQASVRLWALSRATSSARNAFPPMSSQFTPSVSSVALPWSLYLKLQPSNILLFLSFLYFSP